MVPHLEFTSPGWAGVGFRLPDVFGQINPSFIGVIRRDRQYSPVQMAVGLSSR
jgi:hypothetical protein